MINKIQTDNETYYHLYKQLNRFFRVARVKSLFKINQLSSLTADYFIDWKQSLYDYSKIFRPFFAEWENYYHPIPELEIHTKLEKPLKFQTEDTTYKVLHAIKGSLEVKVVDKGEESTMILDQGELLMFDESTYCIVEKLVDKKVCIASFDLEGLFSTAKIG